MARTSGQPLTDLTDARRPGRGAPLIAPRPGPPLPRPPRGLPLPPVYAEPPPPYAEVVTSGGSAPVFAACPYQYALDFGVRVSVA